MLTSVDDEYSNGSYSIKLADDDVSDDVIDDVIGRDVIDDGEVIVQRLVVRLRRSVQLGFGFSAAGERPTTIRSVIKGIATTVGPTQELYK